jgi:hypothetical protein
MNYLPELGWLIERYVGDVTMWWTGESPAYDPVTWWRSWTTDSLKAIRFARKEDAQRIIEFLGNYAFNAKPIEHMWCGPDMT